MPYILLTARRNQQLSHCKQNNFARFLSSADYYFEKVEIDLSGITANYQTGMLKVGTSGLVWVQTVCRVFSRRQKSSLVENELIIILLDFSFTVKAATLIFISGCGLAISSAKEGKSGFIRNLVKS